MNYIMDNWYVASVIGYFGFMITLLIVVVIVSKSGHILEEFLEIGGPFIISGFVPIFNLIVLVVFLILCFIFCSGEFMENANKKKEELKKMNQFYKTNCCDVLVRLHHVYKYNESLENKSVKKCVACKKDITFNDLKIYNDEKLDKYESKIPYQSILSKKEFNKLEDTILNQKSKTLFEEEEAKYIKLTMENLESNKNK